MGYGGKFHGLSAHRFTWLIPAILSCFALAALCACGGSGTQNLLDSQSITPVAADSGFPSHEKIMSWLAYYGAEYVCWLRLFARELGELQGKLGQMRKLDKFSGELVDALS